MGQRAQTDGSASRRGRASSRPPSLRRTLTRTFDQGRRDSAGRKLL